MAFKKGQSGNPKGAAKLSPEVKHMRLMARIDFQRLADKFLHLTNGELRAIMKDDNSTGIDSMVASIILRGRDEGDQRRLDFFLDRTIGKVTEKIVISDPDRDSADRQKKLEEAIAHLKALTEMNKESGCG